MEQTTLADGCFWCTESIFASLKGVESVVSGYAGGYLKSPTYDAVSMGTSGHAESVKVTFNTDEISYRDLLTVFWAIHDPTTLNKQGADIGPQYRSVIFYHDDVQELQAQNSKEIEQKKYEKIIVTEILPLNEFYEAEEDHQNFYENNPEKTYCKIVIDPKIAKLKKDFKSLVK